MPTRRLVSGTAISAVAVIAIIAVAGSGYLTQEASPPEVIRISMIDPPDEADFYEGIQARKPEILDFFTPAELTVLGLRACELRDGTIVGTLPDGSWPPDPREALIGEIDDAYRLPPELESWRVAGVVSNAAEGSLCERVYPEGQ